MGNIGAGEVDIAFDVWRDSRTTCQKIQWQCCFKVHGTTLGGAVRQLFVEPILFDVAAWIDGITSQYGRNRARLFNAYTTVAKGP